MQVPESALSLPIRFGTGTIEYNSNTITCNEPTLKNAEALLCFETDNITEDFSITYTTSYRIVPETHSFEVNKYGTFLNSSNLRWNYDNELHILSLEYEDEEPSDYDPWEITIQSITVGDKTYTSFNFGQ